MDNVEETSCNFPVAAEPTSVALLRRHASPFPRVTEETKHRLEIRRILRDSATQVPHAVPGQGEERSRHEEVDNGWFQRYWKKLAPQLSTVAFWKSLLKHVRPFQQYTDYSLSTFLRKDLVAGCTVAIMAMPLGMSYAQLAGLPPYYGLYSTFVPPIIFPIFGSSRQLAVGPAALTSLLLGPALISIVTDEGLTDTSSAEYLARYAQLAVQCSFLAGLINIGMGLFRLGFLTQFLSRALISGFITGAAVILICSQIKHLFGYPIPSSNRIQNLIKSLAQGISDFNWKTFTIGSICLAVLLTVKFASQNKRISEKYPSIKWLRALAPFIVSAVMIALTFGLDLEDKGIPIVANIPSGLPTASVSQWTPVSSKLFVSD
jgi:sulfate transporter 4